MTAVVPLSEAVEERLYGAKAVGLGAATRAGLPVPPGVALSGDLVDAVAADDAEAKRAVSAALAGLPPPFAVRSSCVDEDGAAASFAGQHLTVLNVTTIGDVPGAVRDIWWSANSDSAITYRQRVGLVSRPSVGVVIQSLLEPDVAGVMFTRNPVTGADERVIEAAWGLGEAVVAGLVIPDNVRLARDGSVIAETPGLKRIAVRAAGTGTVEEDLPESWWERPCLEPAQLQQLAALAQRCEDVYGPDRDVEWALSDGMVYLLQCRAITVGATASVPTQAAPLAAVESLGRVPLLAGLQPAEMAKVARAFKLRRFAAGDTVMKEGAGAAAFFVIDSGHADVTIRGEHRTRLGPGDFFGEVALLDEGARTATVTAVTDLECRGISVWEFKPLVMDNPGLAWQLLQSLARRLRDDQSTSELQHADETARHHTPW